MAVAGERGVFVGNGVFVGTAVSVGVIVGNTSVAVAVGGSVFVGCGVWVEAGELVMVGKKRVGVETDVAGSVTRITACAGVIGGAQAVNNETIKREMIGSRAENSLLHSMLKRCLSGLLSIMALRITKGKSNVKQI